MKTLEDYIREYDLEQLALKNYYNFKKPLSLAYYGYFV